MQTVGQVLFLILELFSWFVVARIIIEMIYSFARSFSAPRWFYVIAEPLFRVTDPPVKFLRRVIPPIRTGGVALDVSVIVLFVIIMFLQIIVTLVF